MLSISDFSQMCDLPPQTLRYYHAAGLLVPADVGDIEEVSGRWRSSSGPTEDRNADLDSLTGLFARWRSSSGATENRNTTHLRSRPSSTWRGSGAATHTRSCARPPPATAGGRPPDASSTADHRAPDDRSTRRPRRPRRPPGLPAGAG
ncbi:MerR family DNA-binding transcriptional regulator [Streptomyces sp. ID05-18]|uniref:MerR family DNA-binding transcriptional regulator n=1 Tax=Streptomyces sp. ID05-18 TaxID=3028662 RepID=UPI003A5C5410